MLYALAQSDATAIPLADQSVDMVFTSPPYMQARTYGIDAQRGCEAWIDWMLDVVRECLRVCRGPVMINCAGQTKDRNYQPGPEGLLYRAWQSGIHAYRPCYWNRVGIPGSGGDQWYRADVEYIFCFKREGKLPWAEPTANGHPPKWAPGGEMSHRIGSGRRVNQWGHSVMSGATVIDGERVRSRGARPSHIMVGGKPSRKNLEMQSVNRSTGVRNRDGSITRLSGKRYEGVAKANPGNVVNVKVGGGLLGHKLAHESEAPFPVKLAEYYIRSHCPPSGIVLDPFSGSGTTVHAAYNLGRIGIGFDLRMNQCDLARRRMRDVIGKNELFHEVA